MSGYFRFPTIHNNTVVFVCEDDLWSVSAQGGRAVRLTSNLGEVSHPFFSPDGSTIAFTGREEGAVEVYSMPADGGRAKRLTYLGGAALVAGWTPDGKIAFSANTAQPFQRMFALHKISADGGIPEQLPVGLARNISFGKNGGIVIGRNTTDPARWKRYRGGTAGVLWIDKSGTGNFERLAAQINGHLASPMWIGDRIFFISDHEGFGNIYSCLPDNSDVRKHTNHSDFYARNASTDGSNIVYHAGGELFLLNPATNENSKIEVEFNSPQIQLQRKFVSAEQFLEDYAIHPNGHKTTITTRGKSFSFGNWEGAVKQIGEREGVRYRLTDWLTDGERFITISDASGEERLEIHYENFDLVPESLDSIDIGRPLEMKVSPTEDKIVLSNHRYELILVDLKEKTSKIIDKSDFHRIGGFSWSPDGKWLAYSCSETKQTSSIKLANIETDELHLITPPTFRDYEPTFDPEGKFLYFLSYREFNPVYDSMYFDLNFPRGMKPFLISLKKETPSPFVPVAKSPDAKKKEAENAAKSAEKSEEKKIKPLEIDFDGIQERIAAFPVPEGRYAQICGVKGKVLFTSYPIKGSLGNGVDISDAENEAALEMYDFESQKRETVATGVADFKISRENETLIYRIGRRLRVIQIAPMNGGKEAADPTPNKKSGWLDLNRAKVSILPMIEWKQMYREIWRLQRENFWTPNMSGINWEKMYDRYLPILEKAATRSEFSDVIWELQGELGTSHAYEMGGDYRKSPNYRQGFLGAEFEYNAESDAFAVKRIVNGDAWNERADSPLHRIGINVQEGDVLLAVNGQRVGKNRSPQECLVNLAENEITLTFAGNEGTNRTVTVKAIGDETSARYREWVENNRRIVHEASGGRVGYVHIPNMGPQGYAEFHRYYLAEIDYESLVVDVRFNGGGHVSQLILEKLARKRISYNVSRWSKTPDPYPSDSIAGPVVAITNEHAGSDGDIFSHCFKLMKLGTLLGKRTWGGVVGIWPRHSLVDGSVTTQPEFSFWFTDVGWGVENYGTNPDIEVEITPQDYVAGKDPQLEAGIALVLKQLEENPIQIPDFSNKPMLGIE